MLYILLLYMTHESAINKCNDVYYTIKCKYGTIENMMSKEEAIKSNDFTDYNYFYCNKGLSGSAWIKINLENTSTEFRRIYLNIYYPHLDSVIIYDGDLISQHGDLINKFQKVDINYPINLSKGEIKNLLISIKTRSYLKTSIKILDENSNDKFMKENYSQKGALLAIYIFSIIICLYHVIFSPKNTYRTYIVSYSLLIIFLCLTAIDFAGYNDLYYSLSPYFFSYLPAMYGNLIVIAFFILFMLTY